MLSLRDFISPCEVAPVFFPLQYVYPEPSSAYTLKNDSFVADKPRLWSEKKLCGVANSVKNVALAPDGKHFAVFPLPEVTPKDKDPAPVTFLLNFFDELRQRVPAGK
jgi:hypothetical protein